MPARPVVLIVEDDPHTAAVLAQTVEGMGLSARAYTGPLASVEAFGAVANGELPPISASVIDLCLDETGLHDGHWLRRAMLYRGMCEPSMLLTGAYIDGRVLSRVSPLFAEVARKPVGLAVLHAFLAPLVEAAEQPRACAGCVIVRADCDRDSQDDRIAAPELASLH